MVRLICAAACGNFERCVIACPQNSTLGSTEVPVCESSDEILTDEDEAYTIVIEEQAKSE